MNASFLFINALKLVTNERRKLELLTNNEELKMIDKNRL